MSDPGRRLWALKLEANKIADELKEGGHLSAARAAMQAVPRLEVAAHLMGYKAGMSEEPKMQTAEAHNSGLTGRVETAPNFPGYNNPAGTTPGQRTGFTEAQIDLIKRVREARRSFVALLHEAGGTMARPDEKDHRFGGPDLTLSFRHMEDAEYRAIKHITGGPK